MSSSKRSASYFNEEGENLGHVGLDISQNTIIGINQQRDKFWSRVESSYNNSKPEYITQCQPLRSVQSGMSIILTTVAKLRGCVRQVELLNPTGASEQDIMNRAEILFVQDKAKKKDFKFDHVWHILKDIEKFTNDVSILPHFQMESRNFASLQSDSPTSVYPTHATPRLSSFSLHIDEENSGGSVQGPIWVKKQKEKEKNEEFLDMIQSIAKNNREITQILKKGSDDRQEIYEIQMLRAESESKKEVVAGFGEENKILLKDLDFVLREFIRSE